MATILVLDDDDLLRDTIAENLEEEGYDVHPAASGADALVLAAGKRFDLILADVRMAGMDGLECLSALRKLQPEARSIVITGFADEDAPVRAVRAKAEDYLHKPFRLNEMLDAVKNVLEARQQREALLSRLMASARKLLTRTPDLESQRDQVFKAFYVGVRSKKLSLSEALHIWDQLEPLEVQRSQSSEAYRYLMDVITAFQRTDMYIHQKRSPGQIETQHFTEFFAKVRSGALSQEQVKLAPFLRSLSPADIAASDETTALYVQVWGALP